MGRFKDWLFGRDPEPEPEPEYADAGVTSGNAYVGPPISPQQAHLIEAQLPDYYDVVDLDEDLDDEPEAEAVEEFPPGTPGWKRKGRPYVHFRTVKIVDRDGGYKFKVRGRSGKPRHKSDVYTEKSNAKRAAVKWVQAQGIPTRFTEDQYGGQVVLDTDPQD